MPKFAEELCSIGSKNITEKCITGDTFKDVWKLTNKSVLMQSLIKLRAYWGKKQEQLLFDGPNRPDMRFLCYKIFNEEVLKELEARGYDISTLKFSIERKPVVP